MNNIPLSRYISETIEEVMKGIKEAATSIYSKTGIPPIAPVRINSVPQTK